MEPARSIVVSLGGPKKVAEALGLTTGAVSKWWAPPEAKGCGGLIPSWHIVALCKIARDRRQFLEPNMFFVGHL